MSFIAVGGLGYSGEIGGRDLSGCILKTIWALFIWLMRAAVSR